MGMRLIRKPRTRGMNIIIRWELRRAYKTRLTPAIIEKYYDVAKLHLWDDEPKFKVRIRIRRSQILVNVVLAKHHKGSQIFRYVDEGTMNEGDPNTTYPIVASDPSKPLTFTVPYQPLTYPPDGLGYDISAPQEQIVAFVVHHPGIKPRRFSEEVKEWIKDRTNPDGFYRITENAYRRAFSRISRVKRALGM
jgi:hypothetical protein